MPNDTPQSQGKRALAGVRVIECCQMVAGPYATKLLADLGAEVIKVEEPGRGDGARHRGPFLHNVPHPERSGLFLYLNTNKRGITLNLRHLMGREILGRLLAEADILVEDHAPAMAQELGLGYETLRASYPRLIVASITPFGQTGPYRDYTAYPLNAYHGGGQGYLTPYESPFPERGPLKAGGYLGEYDGGIAAAVAIMGALCGRLFTGQGQHVDISQQEALVALQRVELSTFPNEGKLESRVREKPSPGGLMPCRDGYVHITTAEEHQWQGLVELMGNPDWARDERFKDQPSRTENAVALNALIAAWVKDRNKEEIYHQGQAKGCPVAMVSTAEDIVRSPQMAARGFFATVDHPETGPLLYPTAPYRFSETPWQVERPAPRLGEHNAEVYGRLGYSLQELAQMRWAGII